MVTQLIQLTFWSSRLPTSFGDAPVLGWIKGGMGTHLQGLLASGFWPQEERHLHINLLEMQTMLLALHALQAGLMGNTVGLMSDITSVVVYINTQGGTVLSSRYLLARQVLP